MSTGNGDHKDSLVVCQNHQGIEIRGSLLRFTRYGAVFEIYNPSLVLRMSEVLGQFRIIIQNDVVYAGQALVTNFVHATTAVVCEVKLDEAGVILTPLNASLSAGLSLRGHFNDFLSEWQKSYRVLPQFKDVMSNLHSFLVDLRMWLEQLDLGIRSSPSGDRQQLERKVVDDLAEPIVEGIDAFIDRFEAIAENLEGDLQGVHQAYLRRQLHPLVLSSPFAYRAYQKPLGYAGDYELVDMMMRPPYEGSTLFAKVLNVWLLGQAPACAHRNRVDYLVRRLVEEAVRVKALGRAGRVYNLGCGPAAEIQRFLKEHVIANQMHFTLLDFNEETLVHVRAKLEEVKRSYSRSTPIEFLKRSVQQLLKEAGRSVPRTPANQYDFIYCAGLFDYLSDQMCKRRMDIFYDLLAPGGLLVATNVSAALNASRPFRYSMEYILDWHLCYRDGHQVRALAPTGAPADSVKVLAEQTGVNVFLEVRKPSDE
jgi:extracellular factor (EF) 3-hydroxypalmitic acid methyl ester biosynthesis protein